MKSICAPLVPLPLAVKWKKNIGKTNEIRLQAMQQGSGQEAERRSLGLTEEPGLLRAAPVSIIVLALCCVVFVIANLIIGGAQGGAFPPGLAAVLTFSPANGFIFPGIISHMFAHGDFAHLLGNMFMLFFFGTVVERAVGSPRFALLYFGSGLFAAFAQAMVTPEAVMLGASGALAGLLAAFIIGWPSVRLLIYGIIPMPAWLFGLLWLLFNLWGAGGMLSGHVAYMAHLGGFFFGLLLSLLVLKHAR